MQDETVTAYDGVFHKVSKNVLNLKDEPCIVNQWCSPQALASKTETHVIGHEGPGHGLKGCAEISQYECNSWGKARSRGSLRTEMPIWIRILNCRHIIARKIVTQKEFLNPLTGLFFFTTNLHSPQILVNHNVKERLLKHKVTEGSTLPHASLSMLTRSFVDGQWMWIDRNNGFNRFRSLFTKLLIVANEHSIDSLLSSSYVMLELFWQNVFQCLYLCIN